MDCDIAMRIAHVITRMIIGGAQENTLYNCADLIQHYNDEVLLLTGPAVGPEGDLHDRIRAAGVPVKLLPELRREIQPLRDWRALAKIRQALAAFRPDVVHTHSAKAGFLGRLAAWNLGVPAVIHTVHGAPFHPYQGRGARTLFRWCETFAARRCHHLVSVADAMTDMLVASGVAPRSKFTTVYSGMEVEPFLDAHQHREAARAEFGFGEEHVVVGKIARLFNLKGHVYLIQAAKQVVALQPNVRFLLVGDGVLRGQFESQIRQAGLADHFHFTGLVAPSRIPYCLSAMDLLAHTSLREGLARTLPQALIAGKPVVSYDIDGAREVIIPGETGYLLRPEAVDELASAIVELAQDKALRQRLGAEGRQRFTDQFRHETMTRRLREIYQETLRGRAGQGGKE